MAAMNNLKQIGLALRDYAEAHDSRLPPAVLRDSQGRPLLSWRVLILPYLEHADLYQQFHLDEPWDSPHNLALLPSMPHQYATPRDLPVQARTERFSTFLQVFTGEGTAFEDSQGLRLPQDFPNGTATAILATEAGLAVPWTKPDDLVYKGDEPLAPLGGIFTGESRFSVFGSNRVKGFNVLMGDGSVRFLYSPTPETALRNAIERKNGGLLEAQ